MGIRWIVLSIIVLASFVAYVLRTNYSIVSESMMTDLGLTEVQLGLTFSAFAAGYALFQFPGGLFGERYGPRFTVALIAVGWGIFTLVTAIIPGTDFWSIGSIVGALIVTRFMVGSFHAPFFPVSIGGSIASWFPLRQWGLANGLTSTGLTLGAAATAPFVVWLMSEFGWRAALLVTAPSGFVVAALFYWYVTNRPSEHPSITPAEIEVIESDRPPAGDPHEKGAWKRVLRDRNVLLITFSYFCMNYVFYLFFSWFFFYLVDVKGFSARDAGYFTAAQWVFGALGAMAGGLLCDYLVKKRGLRLGPRWLVMTALTVSGICLYIGAVSGNPVLSVSFLCLAFAANQLAEAPTWVATMAVSGAHAPAATGVLNTGANLPGILGGVMVPFIAGLFGWSVAMATGTVFALVGAAVWLLVKADQPMQDTQG